MHDIFVTSPTPLPGYPPHTQWMDTGSSRVATYHIAAHRAVTEYFWVVDPRVDPADIDWAYWPYHHQATQLHSWGNAALIHRRSWLANPPAAAQDYEWVRWHMPVPVRRQKIVWDYGDGNINKITGRWPDATVLRYIGTHQEMHRRSQRAMTGPDAFIFSSIVDYSDWNPDWQPTWETEAQLHVWASGDQREGDTFWLPCQAEIGDHAPTQWHSPGLPRHPWPVNLVTNQDLHLALHRHRWRAPYEYFVMPGSEWQAAPEPSLWKNRQITAFNRTGHVSLCPRDCISKISRSILSYPYIQYHNTNNVAENPQDVVFISYDEENADKNYELLLKKAPSAKRIHGVKGNVEAYKAAASKSTTPWFYAVFAKTEIDPAFEFNHRPDYLREPHHVVFYARNSVTGGVYGHGAVKLYHRNITINAQDWGADFTTSAPIKIVPTISCTITPANDWEAWRTAFREAAKLSRDHTIESRYRLSQWLTVGAGPHGDASREGAAAGAAYTGDLLSVNDWAWLKDLFDGCYSDSSNPLNLSV